MDYQELTVLQKQADHVMHTFFEIDLANEHEVLWFLKRIYPFITNINLFLPQEQIFLQLRRHQYGSFKKNMTRVEKEIAVMMKEIETERFLNECYLKHAEKKIVLH